MQLLRLKSHDKSNCTLDLLSHPRLGTMAIKETFGWRCVVVILTDIRNEENNEYE